MQGLPILIERLPEQLAALRLRGLDPATAVCCAPSSGDGKVPGVAGCNMYDNCPFHLTQFGGFKGHGVTYVPYYVKPEDGTTHQKQDYIECRKFVMLLLERMRAGQRDRQSGKKGEKVSIIIHQGRLATHIIRRDYVKVDPKDPNTTYEPKRVVVQVPEYRHPGELEESIEAEIEQLEKDREASDPEFRTGLPPLEETANEQFTEEIEGSAETLNLGVVTQAEEPQPKRRRATAEPENG